MEGELSLNEQKAAAREIHLARRNALNETLRAAWSIEIAGRALACPWMARARAVAGFYGVRSEPDTRPLLATVLAERKRLLLPRVESDTSLSFVEVCDLEQLVPGQFGIHAPPADLAGVPLAQSVVDVVFVTGLAFDRAGYRLGYGHGYYDRALAPLTNSTVVFAGLAFDECLLPEGESVPHAAYDIAVHCVITQTSAHWCTAPTR